jgi:hypothetical protein
MQQKFSRRNILRHVLRHIVTSLSTAIVLAIAYCFFITYIDFEILLSTQLIPYAIAIAIGLVVTLPGLSITASRRISSIFLAIYCVATIGLTPLLLGDRLPFVRLYQDLHPGMTIDQVQQQIARHYPPNGKYGQPLLEQSMANGRPVDNRISIFRDPDDRRRDEIFITVADGRVANIGYIDD